MERKRKFFPVWQSPANFRISSDGSVDGGDIEFEMAAALAQALEGRATTSHIVAHSRRVARVACAIGDMVELETDELDRLRRAAQLHEIGMVGVPAQLLTRKARLTPAELAQVRAQARVGAEIVNAAYGRATSRLIERQYDDYIEVRAETADTRELLLSGLLRVADVFDAVTAPRPYQNPLADHQWRQVLRLGSGSKFHPAAVLALFHWADTDQNH